MVSQTDRFRGLTGSLAIKAPVLVATTEDIALSGEQTIDGVAVVAEDRVLVKNQTDATENGIWDCQEGAWVRSADFDGYRDVVLGTRVAVQSGSTSTSVVYVVATSGAIVIGTTELTFSIADPITVVYNDTALAGATDVALQAAITAAGSGGTVRFEATSNNVCTIAAQINIALDDFKLDLNGATIKVGDIANITALYVTGNRVTIKNGTVDGNKANQTSGTTPVIDALGAEGIKIDNVKVVDAYFMGIRIKDSADAIVSNNHILDSNDIGIYAVRSATGADMRGPRIIDNIVDRESLGADMGAKGAIIVHMSSFHTGDQYTNAVVSGNQIYGTNNAGADEHEGIFMASDGGIVKGNTINQSTIGITMKGGVGMVCDSNTLNSVRDWGIEYTTVTDLSMTGNNVYGNGVTGVGLAQTAAVDVRSDGVTITGGKITGCIVDTAQFKYSDNTVVTGLLLDSTHASAAVTTNVLLEDSDNLVLSGCTIKGNAGVGSGAAVALVNMDTLTITGSRIFGSERVFNFSGSVAPTAININGNYLQGSLGANPVVSTLSSGFGSILMAWNTGDEIDVADATLTTGLIVHQMVTGTPVSTVNTGIGSIAIDKETGIMYIKDGTGVADGWNSVNITALP